MRSFASVKSAAAGNAKPKTDDHVTYMCAHAFPGGHSLMRNLNWTGGFETRRLGAPRISTPQELSIGDVADQAHPKRAIE